MPLTSSSGALWKCETRLSLFHHVCGMFLSCPGHKKCCCQKKMPSYISLKTGIFMLSDNDPARAGGCSNQFGVIWGQCTLPFSTSKSEHLCSPCLLPSSLQWNGLYHSNLLWSINVLPQMSLLWTFYPQVSCHRSTWPCPLWDRRVSSLFFLSLFSPSPPSSCSHLWSCCKSVFTFIHHWCPTLI